MKPYAFEYSRPASVEEALELLDGEDDPRILAGGQSLLPILNMRLAQPSRIIDIGRLPGLSDIERTPQGNVRIGALARHADVMTNAHVRDHLPLLAEAMTHVAHPAVRNRGTFGGSACLADPAAEIPCVSVALDGEFHLRSPRGTRVVKARDFFLDVYETDLAADEIMIAAEFKPAEPDERFAFFELSRRHGDFAIVGLACRAIVEAGVFTRLELCYFGAGPRATLAENAARQLIGSRGESHHVDASTNALATDLSPQDDLQASEAMRLHLAGELLRRAVARLIRNERLDP